MPAPMATQLVGASANDLQRLAHVLARLLATYWAGRLGGTRGLDRSPEADRDGCEESSARAV